MNNALPFKTPNAVDIDVLARTIYGEARGESLLGQIGVAFVVLHRAAVALAFTMERGRPHPLFGDGSIQSACKAHLQFSCWNVNDPNCAKVAGVNLDDAAFQTAMYVAIGTTQRLISDALKSSLYYFAPSGVTKPPAWAMDSNFLGTIGNQRFYSQWQAVS